MRLERENEYSFAIEEASIANASSVLAIIKVLGCVALRRDGLYLVCL